MNDVKCHEITNILVRCKTLTFLNIHVDTNDEGGLAAMERALECIEHGLFETRSWERESLKIKLRIEPNVRSNPADYDCSSLAKKVLREVQSLRGATRDF